MAMSQLRNLLRNACLVAGGATIVAAALFTSTHLADRVVFTVLVPGVVVGLMFVGLYVALGRQDGRRWPG